MNRFRYWFMLGGTFIVLSYLFFTDPNEGTSLIPFIGTLASPVIAVLFAHLARKALFDYLDMSALLKKAKETATGSAIIFLGVCVVIMGLLGLFGSKVYAQDVTTYIPEQAKEHIVTVVKEKDAYWRDHPKLGPLER